MVTWQVNLESLLNHERCTLSPTMGLDLRYHMTSWGEGQVLSQRFSGSGLGTTWSYFLCCPMPLDLFRGTPPRQNSTNHRQAVGNSALRFPHQVAVCHQSLKQWNDQAHGPSFTVPRKLCQWPAALDTPYMQEFHMQIRSDL